MKKDDGKEPRSGGMVVENGVTPPAIGFERQKDGTWRRFAVKDGVVVHGAFYEDVTKVYLASPGKMTAESFVVYDPDEVFAPKKVWLRQIRGNCEGQE